MYDAKIFANIQHSQNPLEAAEKARAQQNFFFNNNTQLYQNRNKQPEQPMKNVQQQSKEK